MLPSLGWNLFIFQLCCSGSPMNLNCFSEEFELLFLGVIAALATTNFKSLWKPLFHSRVHCKVRFSLKKLKSAVVCKLLSETMLMQQSLAFAWLWSASLPLLKSSLSLWDPLGSFQGFNSLSEDPKPMKLLASNNFTLTALPHNNMHHHQFNYENVPSYKNVNVSWWTLFTDPAYNQKWNDPMGWRLVNIWLLIKEKHKA